MQVVSTTTAVLSVTTTTSSVVGVEQDANAKTNVANKMIFFILGFKFNYSYIDKNL
jgi:hypothetical protein